jgi:hypothetical protein
LNSELSGRIKPDFRTFRSLYAQDARRSRHSNQALYQCSILTERPEPANDLKVAMTEKSRTVVVIESHEQTIIRRSRRIVSSELLTQGASSDETARPAKTDRRWFGAWWRAVTQKGANLLVPSSRRTTTRALRGQSQLGVEDDVQTNKW